MLFTIETRYHIRAGIFYGTAKITGPRGVRTISVQAPLPRDTRIAISGEDEVGWFGEDLWKGAKKAVKTVVKNPGKVALGATNLAWVADTVARKIPGYSTATDKFGVTQYANALNKAGSVSLNDLKNVKLTKKKVGSKLGQAVKAVVQQEAGRTLKIPPVGLKAAASFVTAQSVLKAAKEADKYTAASQAVMGALKRDAGAAVQSGGLAGKLISAGLKRGGAKGVESVLTQVQARARAGIHAKNIIAETIRRAQKGDPAAKRFQSTLAIAARAEKKLGALKKVVASHRQSQGLLVLPHGEILRGTFATGGAVRL